MAEHYRFFDSADPLNPDRTYNAQEFTDYFEALVTTGIMKGAGNELKVTATGSNMISLIDSGIAFIEGRYYLNDSPLSLTHDTEVLGMNRIDRIVIRMDLSNEARYVRAFIKKGIPHVTPNPPALTREGNIYEISLARVLVEGGQTYIDADSITDERGIAEICPWAGSKILPNFNDDTVAELYNTVLEVEANTSESKLDVWVDSVNGSDLGDGTQGAPYKNLQRALDDVKKRIAGVRTIHLMPGDYPISMDDGKKLQLNGGLVELVAEGSNVRVDGQLIFHGGTSNVNIKNIESRRPATWTGAYYGIQIQNHSGYFEIDGYKAGLKTDGTPGINGGILNRSATVKVSNSNISNASYAAIASENGGSTHVSATSGSDNYTPFRAAGGVMYVASNNTISGTVEKQELEGGKVFV